MAHNRQWKKRFRFTLVEDDTHRMVKTWHFSSLSAAVTVITVLVVLLGILYALVAFTPLRTTIPGYPDAHFRREAVSNAIRIDSLENAIRRWQLYTDHLSKVLSGEKVEGLDSIVKMGPANYFADKTPEQLSSRDTALRALVVKEEQFGLRNSSPRTLPLEGTLFFTPVKGVVSKGFDETLHPYVDITAPAKTVVCSAGDGTVIFSGWDEEYGYSLVVQHSSNVISVYKHNGKLLKPQGAVVKAGDPLALLGSTGSLATGDHLHFELWHDGVAVNPESFISF